MSFTRNKSHKIINAALGTYDIYLASDSCIYSICVYCHQFMLVKSNILCKLFRHLPSIYHNISDVIRPSAYIATPFSYELHHSFCTHHHYIWKRQNREQFTRNIITLGIVGRAKLFATEKQDFPKHC